MAGNKPRMRKKHAAPSVTYAGSLKAVIIRKEDFLGGRRALINKQDGARRASIANPMMRTDHPKPS